LKRHGIKLLDHKIRLWHTLMTSAVDEQHSICVVELASVVGRREYGNQLALRE
jgi:hypothetical protein